MNRPTTAIRRPRLGPASAGLLMSPEEFDAIPAETWVGGNRYELIRGVLVVSPIPKAGERGPNDYLGHLLWAYQEGHPQGRSLDQTLPEHNLALPTNRRRCDRAIWAGLGRLPDEESEIPAIVVEFVSGRRRDFLRDYEVKRDEYLAAGVREYWVIDRFRRMMTVFTPAPAGPVARAVAESETYRSDLLPGFELPLARLLAKADEWRRRRPQPRPRRPPTDRGAE